MIWYRLFPRFGDGDLILSIEKSPCIALPSTAGCAKFTNNFKLDLRNWSHGTYQHHRSRTPTRSQKPRCSHILFQRNGVQYSRSHILYSLVSLRWNQLGALAVASWRRRERLPREFKYSDQM